MIKKLKSERNHKLVFASGGIFALPLNPDTSGNVTMHANVILATAFFVKTKIFDVSGANNVSCILVFLPCRQNRVYRRKVRMEYQGKKDPCGLRFFFQATRHASKWHFRIHNRNSSLDTSFLSEAIQFFWSKEGKRKEAGRTFSWIWKEEIFSLCFSTRKKGFHVHLRLINNSKGSNNRRWKDPFPKIKKSSCFRPSSIKQLIFDTHLDRCAVQMSLAWWNNAFPKTRACSVSLFGPNKKKKI